MLPIFAYHVTHYLRCFYLNHKQFYRLNDPLWANGIFFNVQNATVGLLFKPVVLWTIMVIVTLAGHMLSVMI